MKLTKVGHFSLTKVGHLKLTLTGDLVQVIGSDVGDPGVDLRHAKFLLLPAAASPDLATEGSLRQAQSVFMSAK